jgi:Mrp family chromosome partitioning ATPase
LALGNETEVEFQRLGSTVSSHSLKDRRLLITSSNVGEGKTTVTLGLAKALVDLGFRVLVVDGDFRQAKLSQRLGASQEPTSNNLPISIGTRLDLVPTVPKQGRIIEVIKRRHFKRSLAAAQSSNNYDYVLVDTAPVSLTNETALMAEAIPNVLFVVRPGISDRNSVNDSLGQLAQHNAQVVGLVTNEVDTKTKASEYEFNIHSTLSNVTSE